MSETKPVHEVFISRRQSMLAALAEQRNIMGAVILRDLRTRFFNHGLGFLIVPAFPFVHLFALLLLHNLAGSEYAYGEDANVFLATGLIPTLSFMYVSRFMGLSLLMNRPMLAYPIIGMLEVVFARAILEILGAVWMAAAVISVLYAVGSDPLPADPVQAFLAFCTTLLLSVSVGLLVALVTAVFETFVTVWALTLILFYIASGSLFVVSLLPAQAVRILAWNPVLHCTEWMRTAYYPSYPEQVLDKGYLLAVAFGALVLGLAAERALRRRILGG
ncbi:ABC transporter permease [Loktanella sp. IMCC34160]|uniref:ABC transporter permease n=1 Tax=Loktanella sp. IMCC34160 TaxID=2510646 RepID=UPI0013EAD950|nr:ABC transporter permease [Loktanella sp. IMCC34160]